MHECAQLLLLIYTRDLSKYNLIQSLTLEKSYFIISRY